MNIVDAVAVRRNLSIKYEYSVGIHETDGRQESERTGVCKDEIYRQKQVESFAKPTL